MFEEPILNLDKTGWTEVICGSMFSGKTEELIRRLKRAKIANLRVAIYKPILDDRFHENNIVSHDENSEKASPICKSTEILENANEVDVIGIDEAQFFDDDIVEVCSTLARMKKRVIIAGLDMDYLGKPFGPMPNLLAIANYVTKLHAVCVKCGGTASYSYRFSQENSQILIGEKDQYEARCRNCYYS